MWLSLITGFTSKFELLETYSFAKSIPALVYQHSFVSCSSEFAGKLLWSIIQETLVLPINFTMRTIKMMKLLMIFSKQMTTYFQSISQCK